MAPRNRRSATVDDQRSVSEQAAGLTTGVPATHQRAGGRRSPAARGGFPHAPDPYERLQAARTAVKALQDERSTLAARLAELARGGDETTS
jgi:hypothetical protein